MANACSDWLTNRHLGTKSPRSSLLAPRLPARPPVSFFSIFHARRKAAFGFRIVLEDFESFDPELYRSKIQYLRQSKYADSGPDSMITTLEDLELYFVDDSNNEAYSSSTEVELKPGGGNEMVTEGTKAEYLQLLVEHRLIGGKERNPCSCLRV